MKVGNYYYTDGLDMKCNPTVERVKLVRLLEDNVDFFDCVILCSDGIKMMANTSDLRENKLQKGNGVD